MSLFILLFFVVGLILYYFKYQGERKELQQFDYSKPDSAFNAINFENQADSVDEFLSAPVNQTYKAKEIPKNKIDINSAGLKELTQLPGVGDKTAQKILDYRTQIKTFKNIDQLKSIKGITENKFSKIKDYIYTK